jgi:hypothetical protein
VDFKADDGLPTFFHRFSPYSFVILSNVEHGIITRAPLMKTGRPLAEESLDMYSDCFKSLRQSDALEQVGEMWVRAQTFK